MAGKRKGKNPRLRSKKELEKRRIKTKIYKERGWKLEHPDLFMEIKDFPYIVKRKKEK